MAREAYDAVLDANDGRIDSLMAVEEEVERRASQAIRDASWLEARASVTRSEDDLRRQQGVSLQYNIFSGEPDALDGVFAVRGGGRVRVRAAEYDDWMDHIDYHRQNARQANFALDTELGKFAKLSPYLRVPKTSTESARESYFADHPNERPPAPTPDPPPSPPSPPVEPPPSWAAV